MIVFKYGTSHCGQCKVTSENLKALGLEVIEVDVEDNPEIVEKVGVKSIPYTEFCNSEGEIVMKAYGLLTKDNIKEILKNINSDE